MKQGLRAIASAALALASAHPASACMQRTYVKQDGETDDRLKGRIEADQEAARRYQALPARDRAAIDQARWWEFYPQVYVARVERISIKGRVYPAPPEPKPRRSGILAPPPPVPVPVPPPLITLEGHKAWLRPIARLNGEGALPPPGWHDVGGQTSCGGAMDGSLGYTFPGETVIVFADEGSLFGLAPADAAEPRLLAALRREGLAPRPLR